MSIQFLNFGEDLYHSFQSLRNYFTFYIKGNTTFKENFLKKKYKNFIEIS